MHVRGNDPAEEKGGRKGGNAHEQYVASLIQQVEIKHGGQRCRKQTRGHLPAAAAGGGPRSNAPPPPKELKMILHRGQLKLMTSCRGEDRLYR